MKTLHLSVFILLCLGVNGLSSEVLQRQKRNWIIDSFSIDEGYKGPYPYILGKISVEKELSLFEIHGQGVDEDPKDLLEIHPYTGEISVKGPVDFEKYEKLLLRFQALDRLSRQLDTRLGIELQIIDANDNPPIFDPKSYTTTIKESLTQGEVVITISATDLDRAINGQFEFRIVSVTPQPDELEFYFSHTSDMSKTSRTATISFKGCLDHEKAKAYTIIVEAKDRGEKTQLSSSCTVEVFIEDGNNHIPVVTGITGPGKVREGETNVLVSRLQVKDEDTKGSAAWRVKYKINGEPNQNFRITTDPDTNEGLLYAEKHLSYEDGPERNLTISLENEAAYHSCKVVRRSTTGLWEITQITGVDVNVIDATVVGKTLGQSTWQMTVIVEDVNEAPIFDEANKKAHLKENSGAGKYLSIFKATDPDVNSANTFIYKIGDDPADWVTVDNKTGVVKTKRDIDRESVFVKDGIYVVTVLAIDDGKPPMTGTATLSIRVNDENDNAPNVTVRIIDMCQDNKISKANITVVDLDEEPFGGPFSFKLHGDVKGKWRIEPERGNSVHLVKEMTVYSGHHELVLEVFDLQDKSAVHNLSVTVCDCEDKAKPNCRIRKPISTSAGGGASLIIFLSILMFAGMLLLTILLSCKRDVIQMPWNGYNESLMPSNTEKQGEDTKVDLDRLNRNGGQLQKKSQGQLLTKTIWNGYDITTTDSNTAHNRVDLFGLLANSENNEEQRSTSRTSHGIYKKSSTCVSSGSHQEFMSKTKSSRQQKSSSFTRGSTGGRSIMRKNGDEKAFMIGHLVKYSQHSKHLAVERQVISQLLMQKLELLQAPGVELHDYTPHVYAEEEEMEVDYDLDAISIQDTSFDPDLDLDLDFRFSTLALICKPQESIAYSTKTSCITENIQTATVIQVESYTSQTNSPQ